MAYKEYKLRVLNEEQIRRLSTPRLLAYQKKVMGCRERGDCGHPNEVTKDKLVWIELRENIRVELSKREHVDRK
jgi:hypothetical protein